MCVYVCCCVMYVCVGNVPTAEAYRVMKNNIVICNSVCIFSLFLINAFSYYNTIDIGIENVRWKKNPVHHHHHIRRDELKSDRNSFYSSQMGKYRILNIGQCVGHYNKHSLCINGGTKQIKLTNYTKALIRNYNNIGDINIRCLCRRIVEV